MSNHFVRNGLYMGLALSLIYLALYFVNKGLLVEAGLMTLIGFAVPIYFMWKAGRDERDDQGGLASFGEMFRVTFFAFVIGSFISQIANFALFKADKELVEMQVDKSMEMSEGMIEMMSSFVELDEEAKEKQREEMEKSNQMTRDMMMNMGVGMFIMAWLTSLFFGAIISLILGAILKRNPTA